MEHQFDGMEFVAGHQCQSDVDWRGDLGNGFHRRHAGPGLSGEDAAVMANDE
jgi:hypothetical protein